MTEAYEVSAGARRVDDMLRASSVAHVGASPRDDNIAGSRPWKIASMYSESVSLYRVNPKYDTSDGFFARVEDIGSPPDIGLITVPADSVIESVRCLAELGTRNFIVSAMGFGTDSETEMLRRQQLAALVAERGLTMLGPGSLGVAALSNNLYATFSGAFELGVKRGSVSVVSQSGAIATTLTGFLAKAGIGIDCFVATGSAIGLGFEDVLESVVSRPDTRIILTFLEEIDDLDRLLRVIYHGRMGGRVIGVLSGGSTPAGASAAQSHTGAKVGSYGMMRDLIRGAGGVWAEDILELVEIARVGATVGSQVREDSRGRVGILTNSGGVSVLLSDALSDAGFTIPDLQASTESSLREVLPAYIKVGNPLDVGDRMIREPHRLGAWIKALEEDPGLDLIVMVATSIFQDEDVILRTIEEAFSRQSLPFVPIMLPPLQLSELKYSSSVTLTVAALRSIWSSLTDLPQPAVDLCVESAEADQDLEAIDEIDTKGFIGEGGGVFVKPWSAELPVERRISQDDLQDEFGVASGYTVVKWVQAGLGQRLSKGLVMANLSSWSEVVAAVEAVTARAEDLGLSLSGDARLLLERQAPEGCDILLAVHIDERFGPLVFIGPGGSAGDLKGDGTWLLEPSGPDEIYAKMQSKPWWVAIAQRNGIPERGEINVARAAYELHDVALRQGLSEIELNPVRVVGEAIWCLDARSSRSIQRRRELDKEVKG